MDRVTIARALAIADPPLRRIVEDAPWLPARHATPAVPAYLPWLALLVPLSFATLWLANSLALRKAYLRRRPPELPPLHIDLVAETLTHVTYPANLFRRIAQQLQGTVGVSSLK